jgi:Rrf2 family nitric oxide-sensitive transcriptional repressor
MQLKRQTDYALRVLIFLASTPKGQLVNMDQISNKFNILQNHLRKIIAKLAQLKYIVTRRGNGGGIQINLNVLNLNLFEIMQHFETSFESIDCEGLNCPISNNCKLQLVLNDASNAYIEELKKHKLKDILPTMNREKKVIFNKVTYNEVGRLA